MSRPTITFLCRTETCDSKLTVARDNELPLFWTCPICEQALEQQMLNDLERRHLDAKRHEPLIHEPTF